MPGPLNCSDPPNVLNADSDIVGPGVLAAFFLTATITILAVIFAYLSDALDESLMNELDRKVIARFRKGWRRLKRVRTDLSSNTENETETIREARKEAVTQFILNLSDQQLVTGLAILIAGVSDPRHLSGYEFTVVLALAWFSSTTHLTTLTALGKYMDTHGLVRDAQVVGMVVVLLLIIYSLILSPPAAGSSLPIQCVFQSSSLFSGGISGPMEDSILAMVLFMLVCGYVVRIQDLYLSQRNPAFFPALVACRTLRGNTGGAAYREDVADRMAQHRLSSLRASLASTGLPQRIRLAAHQYRYSFLSTLADVEFSFAYGLTQVVS
ncbi:hypothetical protein LTR85_007295 [Meristemomyces frigidus]|nr:hypothetical protein LTR85_007295 [Meristemomyces frigidus]